MHAQTTLRIKTKVKTELGDFRNFSKESYSDIIFRLINIAKDTVPISDDEITQIEKSLEDIKKGRVLPLKEAEKKWGV